MKVTSSWQTARRCALLLSLVAGWSVSGISAPPPAPAPKEEDPNIFKKMGSFLFKKTRDFEKSQEPPPAVPPPNAGQNKPKTGRRPQTPGSAASQPIPGTNSSRRGETQYLREDPSRPGTGTDGSDSKGKGEKGAGTTEKTAGANEVMGPPAPLSYAVPVAGRVGFVYPPGAERTEANMLDVRGLAPGQKARDPRTGNTFLVP
ncbi:hypothetical protein [Verrucomicrobium sp. BvORR106]|uniref:hypothetical protein n=1 Tax=Verrucomicrobium sp. BvORR106 TaxID=1403819 RepID=UPI00056ED119|nr:hypothetical protein [Verrucomicrobium sp. BvORR106]